VRGRHSTFGALLSILLGASSCSLHLTSPLAITCLHYAQRHFPPRHSTSSGPSNCGLRPQDKSSLRSSGSNTKGSHLHIARTYPSISSTDTNHVRLLHYEPVEDQRPVPLRQGNCRRDGESLDRFILPLSFAHFFCRSATSPASSRGSSPALRSTRLARPSTMLRVPRAMLRAPWTASAARRMPSSAPSLVTVNRRLLVGFAFLRGSRVGT
jgi:hypothetical protein